MRQEKWNRKKKKFCIEVIWQHELSSSSYREREIFEVVMITIVIMIRTCLASQLFLLLYNFFLNLSHIPILNINILMRRFDLLNCYKIYEKYFIIFLYFHKFNIYSFTFVYINLWFMNIRAKKVRKNKKLFRWKKNYVE